MTRKQTNTQLQAAAGALLRAIRNRINGLSPFHDDYHKLGEAAEKAEITARLLDKLPGRFGDDGQRERSYKP